MSHCNSIAYRLVVAAIWFAPAVAVAQVRSWPPQGPLTQPAQPQPAQPPGGSPPSQAQVAAPSQQIACDPCVRGIALLDAMGSYGNTLRMHAKYIVATLVAARVENGTLNGEQEQQIRRLVTSYGGELLEPMRKLPDQDEQELVDIGYALCKSPDPECGTLVGSGLLQARQLARTTVLPAQEPLDPRTPPYGLPHDPGTCDPYVVHVKSPKLGFGFEYATGWQDSAKPGDGRAWSLGLEARARVKKAFGLVARVDRSTGRDESVDADGDGRDDVQTGTVTRWTMLIGPSMRLTEHRSRDAGRYWQVDSLVGLSRDASRSGPIVALDTSYQFVVLRTGVRMMQGLGDAGEESSVLVHTGLMFGAGPQYHYGAGCGIEPRPSGSAWAIAFDLPLSGVTDEGDYIAPGFGLEAAYHFQEYVDGLVRADLLVMPQGERERALHQALLVGGRLDLHGKRGKGQHFFTTVAAGYDHVSTTSSDRIQSGPVIEGSIAWGAQASDGAAWLRLHGRFGVGSDNDELRAFFLSFGTELRLDRKRWRDRN